MNCKMKQYMLPKSSVHRFLQGNAIFVCFVYSDGK